MTRHYVLSTLSVQYWEEKIELDQYYIEELRFWRTNFNFLKCLYGQQGFYSYGSSILCKKVWSKGKWFSEADWIRNRIIFILFYSIYKKDT